MMYQISLDWEITPKKLNEYAVCVNFKVCFSPIIKCIKLTC